MKRLIREEKAIATRLRRVKDAIEKKKRDMSKKLSILKNRYKEISNLVTLAPGSSSTKIFAS